MPEIVICVALILNALATYAVAAAVKDVSNAIHRRSRMDEE